MRVRRVNERLLIVDELSYSSLGRLASSLSAELHEGVEEVVASRGALGIYGLPTEGWEDWILGQDPAHLSGRLIEIPVCYELGEDVGSAADSLGLAEEELIDLHSSAEFECFAVGFQPGFAYLGPLPTPLVGLPRLGSPRVRVPAGSVGMCLDQTGVYPSVSPGGWHLIGRCPLCLVDVSEGYFPISAGDSVRFVPIDEAEFVRREGERL